MIPYLIIYLLTLINVIILCLIYTIWVAVTTVYERNLLSSIQQRIGPYEVGFKGSIQFFADSLNLLSNGILILLKWAKLEIITLSIISIFLVYTFWPHIYLGLNCLLTDIEYNIVYIIILSCLVAYSIINIGIISNNNFSLLASLSYSIVTMNGELLLGFLWTFIIMIVESVSFGILSCISHKNFLFLALLPLLTILTFCFCIETGSTPLDFGESESELIAGYITELSGFLFTLFYLGEYFHLLIMSNTYSIIFFWLN